MQQATHRPHRPAHHAPNCRSGAADWYHALPPITRSLLTCYVVTGLSFYLGIMPLQYFYHDWGRIFKRVPEVRAGVNGCGWVVVRVGEGGQLFGGMLDAMQAPGPADQD